MASYGDTGELILIRHGETTWSRELKHTGRTDIPLTAAGEAAAARLAADLAARHIAAAFASPSQRAVRTAELAGLTKVPSGLKIDYGRDPQGPPWVVPVARRRHPWRCRASR